MLIHADSAAASAVTAGRYGEFGASTPQLNSPQWQSGSETRSHRTFHNQRSLNGAGELQGGHNRPLGSHVGKILDQYLTAYHFGSSLSAPLACRKLRRLIEVHIG